MKILVAEDDAVSRRLLERHLGQWGYETVAVEDGEEALRCFLADEEIGLMILDWMMPHLNGVELCRRVRAECAERSAYLLMITGRSTTEDVIEALAAGADEFLAKPIRAAELRARIAAGVRTLQLQVRLRDRIRALDEAMAHVKQLQGLLPICMHCKRIRDEKSTWHRMEHYLESHADISFSHGLCEHCVRERYPELPELSVEREAPE